MAETVFVLGAGFSCSLEDPQHHNHPTAIPPPLTTNFFNLLFSRYKLNELLPIIRSSRRQIPIDSLFTEIEHYWHLSMEDLSTSPFDLEECMTFFESRMRDSDLDPSERLEAAKAGYVLRALLLSYMTQVNVSSSPMGKAFGRQVLQNEADVITFNYDTAAEEAITYASEPGRKRWRKYYGPDAPPVPDADLDTSDKAWNSVLAYGFKFDEIDLPFPVMESVSKERFYANRNNRPYGSKRVLKLHGSTNWLRYSNNRFIPQEMTPHLTEQFPQGIVLDRGSIKGWMLEPVQRGAWYMDPLMIPPLLYKEYDEPPYAELWKHALHTLSEAKTLIVVGYSFPATDFRTRRLFLEAFGGTKHLQDLIVVDPIVADPSKAEQHDHILRSLTGFTSDIRHFQSLAKYYGTSTSWPSVDILPGLRVIDEHANEIDFSKWVREENTPKDPRPDDTPPAVADREPT